MKNLRNLFVLILSLLMLLPTGTAYAAGIEDISDVDTYVSNIPSENSLPSDYQVIELYVNDVRVRRITAYKVDGFVWLSKYSDLYSVFPKETENMVFATENQPTLLSPWAIDFGYKMVVTEDSVHLSKKETSPETPSTPTPSVPSIPTEPSIPTVPSTPGVQPPQVPSTPGITIPETVKLYVNGLLVKDISVTINSNNRSFVSSYSDIKKIFPNETKYMTFPAVTGGVLLESWAANFGYTYIQKGYRIYLSNTGVTPIEVYLNSAIIEFPDQQPIIVGNRTMIPIRAVSESLGWNVSWGENVVTITNNYHTLILYIGKNYYTIDSVRKTMDVPAQIMNGRTMVPIRFVAEAFGYNVGYDGTNSVKIVTLNK